MDRPTEAHLPANFRIASARRRFLATLVNLVALGGLAGVAKLAACPMNEGADNYTTTRSVQVGLLILVWAICGLAHSPGALLCVSRRYSSAYQPLNWRISLVRASPFRLLGGIGLLAEGAAVLVSGRSLLDRCFKTITLQLSLPPHLMPMVFGFRLR